MTSVAAVATSMAIFYALANLIAGVMLVCMLQSTFLHSSRSFRHVGWFTVAALAGCFLAGLVAIGEAALLDIMELSFAETAKSGGFALMLVLIRVQQVRDGRAYHPRQREEGLQDRLNASWARATRAQGGVASPAVLALLVAILILAGCLAGCASGTFNGLCAIEPVGQQPAPGVGLVRVYCEPVDAEAAP